MQRDRWVPSKILPPPVMMNSNNILEKYLEKTVFMQFILFDEFLGDVRSWSKTITRDGVYNIRILWLVEYYANSCHMKISWNSTKISIGKNDLSLNSGQGETPYRLIINWDISNSLITFFKQLHRICTWKVVIKNSSSWVCFEIAVGTGRPGPAAAQLA